MRRHFYGRLCTNIECISIYPQLVAWGSKKKYKQLIYMGFCKKLLGEATQ